MIVISYWKEICGKTFENIPRAFVGVYKICLSLDHHKTQKMFHVRQEQNYSCCYPPQESEHTLDRVKQASNYLAKRHTMLSRYRYRRDGSGDE